MHHGVTRCAGDSIYEQNSTASAAILASHHRTPNAACEHLESAKNALLEERHDLVGISEFTNDDWEQLGIQLGIGRRLRRDVRKFK